MRNRHPDRIIRITDMDHSSLTVHVGTNGSGKYLRANVWLQVGGRYNQPHHDAAVPLTRQKLDELIVALQTARDEMASVHAEASALRKAAKP